MANRCAMVMMAALALLPAIPARAASLIKHVMVIVMENANADDPAGAYIYGNGKDAPFINGVLMPQYARAVNFTDPLAMGAPSEPHYVYLEAGTQAFADFTFGEGVDGDFDPSARRSSASRDHLTAQIAATGGRVSWMTYQEGLSAKTGACPVRSSGKYAAKHNPFVFFQDVSGNPPARDNEYCAAHTRPYKALAEDMAADRMASYVFVTPNLCHDMHDKCGAPSRIRAGDDWLKAELPAMIDWATRANGVIFLTWDEGNNALRLPFLAIGPHVKAGYAGKAAYDHGSLIKTAERIFGLPFLNSVKGKNDLSDLFKPGTFY